jgi:hypothetical protein
MDEEKIFYKTNYIAMMFELSNLCSTYSCH